MRYTSVQEIEYAAEQHKFAIADFLRSRGWKETSETPGCYVVWTREWAGQKLMASESLAVDMQGDIDLMGPCPDCGKDRDECECMPF